MVLTDLGNDYLSTLLSEILPSERRNVPDDWKLSRIDLAGQYLLSSINEIDNLL